MSLIYIRIGSTLYPFTNEMIEKVGTLNNMLATIPPENDEVQLDIDPKDFDKLYNKLIYMNGINLLLLAFIANQLEVTEILNEIKRNIRKFSIKDLLDNFNYYRDIPEIRSKAGVYIFLSGDETEWAKKEFVEAFKRKYPDYQVNPYFDVRDDLNINGMYILKSISGKKTILIDRKKRLFIEHDGTRVYGKVPIELKLPIPPGNGPIYTITYDDLYFNMVFKVHGRFYSGVDVNTFSKILSEDYNIKLNKGDMVHIPYYDEYFESDPNIYFIMIFNGRELIYPSEYSADIYPGRDFPFPEFSFEFFHIFVITGDNKYNRRFINKDFIKLFNSVDGEIDNGMINKLLNINGKIYRVSYEGDNLDPDEDYFILYRIDSLDEENRYRKMMNAGIYDRFIIEEYRD